MERQCALKSYHNWLARTPDKEATEWWVSGAELVLLRHEDPTFGGQQVENPRIISRLAPRPFP